MDAERFQALLDAYGGRPERWPAAERASAEAYLAATPEAAALAVQARALDGWLDAWTPAPASAALRERILEAVPRPREGWSLRPRRVLWASAGLAAACCMGIIVGADVADPGRLSANAALDAAGAVLTTSDTVSVFGAALDLGKSS
jgi:hypothetical protein